MTKTRRDDLRAATSLILLACLSGCGDLPQPFRGNPGGIAMRLAVPPPARLAVATPDKAMLDASASLLFAKDISDALLAQEVPAVAQPAKKWDWRLQATVSQQGAELVPRYGIYDPNGILKGSIDGVPVPAAGWARGNEAELQQAAAEAGPKLAELLTAIQASQMQSDPGSLMNRPAKIYFAGVSGAPGDGDLSLARQIAVALPDGGNIVQEQAAGADFTLRGQVKVGRLNKDSDHVEIVWTVLDAHGVEAGRVAQLNDIPAHTLDGYWGDIAGVVAREAAGGIRQVITNNSGRDHKPLAAAAHGASLNGHKTVRTLAPT